MKSDWKQWYGMKPEKCQICRQDLKGAFVDGRTRTFGSWAIMCLDCHKERGTGLGLGKGQLYQLQGTTYVKTTG